MKRQKILDYCRTSDAIEGYNDSLIARKETSDCVVRGIASAFNMKYDDAHDFVKNIFGRKDRKGTMGFILGMQRIEKEEGKINGKRFYQVGEYINGHITLKYPVKVKGESRFRNMTTSSFIKKYPEGTYIVKGNHHVFVIKDGIIMGNWTDATKPRKIIYSAWRVI